MSFSRGVGPKDAHSKESGKGAGFDVKPFRFGELRPQGGDSRPNGEVSPFELKSLRDSSSFKERFTEDDIREERAQEKDKSFSILPLVREHRGLKQQEERDYAEAIERETQARVEAAVEESRREGYRAGHEEGYAKAYEEAMGKLDHKVEDFADMVGSLRDQCHKVLSENKADAYKMVKSLVQWISLKEVEKEGYLERLLEKLILEMNTKNNLVVRVSQESFKAMPDVVKQVEAKLGQLTNVRVEADLDQEGPGIILESDNGIIDGSIKAQMASLDRIFESVVVDE